MLIVKGCSWRVTWQFGCQRSQVTCKEEKQAEGMPVDDRQSERSFTQRAMVGRGGSEAHNMTVGDGHFACSFTE